MGTCALGVYDPFRDPLACKIRELLDQVMVLHQQGSAFVRAQGMLVVGARSAAVGRKMVQDAKSLILFISESSGVKILWDGNFTHQRVTVAVRHTSAKRFFSLLLVNLNHAFFIRVRLSHWPFSQLLIMILNDLRCDRRNPQGIQERTSSSLFAASRTRTDRWCRHDIRGVFVWHRSLSAYAHLHRHRCCLDSTRTSPGDRHVRVGSDRDLSGGELAVSDHGPGGDILFDHGCSAGAAWRGGRRCHRLRASQNVGATRHRGDAAVAGHGPGISRF